MVRTPHGSEVRNGNWPCINCGPGFLVYFTSSVSSTNILKAMSDNETPTPNLPVKSHHVLLFVVIVAVLLAFHFRRQLAERFEVWRNRRRWNSLASGFENDLEAGFSSGNFDIAENIRNHDPRTLDEEAKEHIRNLMLEHNLTFDDARLRYLKEKMRDNGVDENGMPLDPRTVTFGS